jgi:hypothetical protein
MNQGNPLLERSLHRKKFGVLHLTRLFGKSAKSTAMLTFEKIIGQILSIGNGGVKHKAANLAMNALEEA